MIRLVEAKRGHVAPIARAMREWDRVECAAFGRTPRQALRLGLAASALSATVLMQGRPIAMFGVTPISVIEGRGCVWFLGTDAVRRFPRELLVLGRYVLDEMQARFPRLENHVARGNRDAVRMLRHWGFDIDDAAVTIGGVEFVPFHKEI